MTVIPLTRLASYEKSTLSHVSFNGLILSLLRAPSLGSLHLQHGGLVHLPFLFVVIGVHVLLVLVFLFVVSALHLPAVAPKEAPQAGRKLMGKISTFVDFP